MNQENYFGRGAGILMPVSGLPSPHGIGDFGASAFAFVDFLQLAGQKYWQVLPLGPTSFGDSPYQNFSAFAGNPYFISLDILEKEGLLTRGQIITNQGGNPEAVDYQTLYNSRIPLLKSAFQRYKTSGRYTKFCNENTWLDNYALFMALKAKYNGIEWLKWDEPDKKREPQAMEKAKSELRKEIDFWKFVQYKFFMQWNQLKAYTNQKGISIIGDIPIYVAMDSADTWEEPEVFYLDGNLMPIDVAGCPPDAFSTTGQLWGNPLYRWDYQIHTGFAWWRKRMQYTAVLYNVIRIDHFRGLESYYAIPYGNPTAENGAWRKGPGIQFFNAIEKNTGGSKLILEDLGFITEQVYNLRMATGLPGMKILQFAFDSREESDYLPHNYERNSVVYTGTHDNDTIAGWFRTAAEADVDYAIQYLHIQNINEGNWSFIRAAYSSVSALAIIPMQDFLNLGSESRINTPSTLGTNWRWRMLQNQATNALAHKIAQLANLYGRSKKA